MKKTTTLSLLLAGILLSFTACEKGPQAGKLAGDVNLTIVTAEGGAATKTAYSGDGTWVDANDHSKGLTWERINWSVGDEILIWGTNVTVRNEGEHPDYDGATNIATYTVSGVSKKNDTQSLATISDNNGYGLRYDDGASSYTFWGIYPAGAVVGESAPTGRTVSYAIAAEQGNADMQQAVMLSVLEGASPAGTNTMEFYPAFTAYQFDITTATDENFLLKQITITSANGTTALCGTVTATIAAGGESTYAVSGGGSSITCTPETALPISNTQNAVVTIFANPNGSEGLKVSFVLGMENSSAEIVRTATLKKKNDQNQMVPLSFAGCKKHVIKGIILPTDAFFDKFTLKLQVLGWDEVIVAGDAAEFPQVTQFSVSGEGVLNGDTDLHRGGEITNDNRKKDPYRQEWYFKPGQTVNVFFKVMLPAGGSWEVEPVNLPEGFTITNVSGTTPTNQLYGAVKESGSTDVKLEITYTGTENGAFFYFHTYVYSGPNKTGTKFNVDSETQLYDRGRGYHTFVVYTGDTPTVFPSE